MSDVRTLISTQDGTWRTVEYDERSGEWVTIESGRVVIETRGDLPPFRGAYLPGVKSEAVCSE